MKKKAVISEGGVQTGAEGVHTDLIGGRSAEQASRTRRTGTMGNDLCGGRFWMLLALTFMAISIGLSIYLVYVKEFEDSSDSKDISLAPNETEILAEYPSFFRTLRQQAVLEKTVEEAVLNGSVVIAPNDTTHLPQFCEYQCFGNEGFEGGPTSRKKRSPRSLIARRSALSQERKIQSVLHRLVKRQTSQDTFHGCCISQRGFISPSVAQTDQGAQVTVVQFASRRQYFPTEQCSQAQGCTGCQCAQEIAFFSAVVRHDDGDDNTADVVKLAFIRIPGCCKCFNNLSGKK